MSIADCEQEESGWGVLEGLPGDPMMWVLVFSELVAFGLFFGAFIVARAVRPAVFASGQTALDLTLAGCNTVVLVTSGWAAAKGAASARAADGRRARLWLVLAMVLGVAFVTIKLVEYAHEIGAGIDLETSVFFTLYFLLTGFHLLHVCLGIVILAVVCRRADPVHVETGTVFWHMIDLVWIVMFPIVYLVR
ncbi:cytochrome c oxidase subunit 3 family protein [Bradyrhizobium icense]|uniref:Copper oxidase n=1 Tax=Bradyrhizobium icense TaxID=1274631 RepID=A0A1B1UC85_9BRAD|nr:cytochrome c oxidase subunit 3 family protein [Bradyrhizobium icense]ANW00380.1 copper oxidase [Bradyrhizobium icense]